MTGERRGVLAISIASSFAFVGGGAIQTYLGPYLKEVLGIHPLKASLVLATVYSCMALGRFIVPWLIRRLGAAAALAIGAATYVTFPFTFGFSRSFPVFILSAALWGLGASLFWTAAMAELLNFSDVKRYAANQGVQRVFVQASQVVGFFLLGQALVVFGYASLFRLAALLSLPAIFVALLAVPPSRPVLPPGHSGPGRRSLYAGRRLILLSLFVSGVSYGLILNVLNLLVSDLFGKAWMNKTLIFFYVVSGVFSYVGGAFSDRFGRRNGFLLAFACGFVGTAALAFWPTLFNVALASVLLGVVFGMAPTVTAGLIGDHSRPEERPLALASFFLWRDVGVAASVFLGGALLQSALSYKAILLFFSLLFLLITALFFKRRDLTAVEARS